MLNITTSPSTSAVSTDGLREITVVSTIARGGCAVRSVGVGMVLFPRSPDLSLLPDRRDVEAAPLARATAGSAGADQSRLPRHGDAFAAARDHKWLTHCRPRPSARSDRRERRGR